MINVPEILTLSEVDDAIEKLSKKRLEIIFNTFKVEALNNISVEKYNELKIKVRDIYNFNKKINLLVPFEINCDLYEYKKEVHFEINPWCNEPGLNVSNSDFFKTSEEFNIIKNDLITKLDNIKSELFQLNIDYPLFITKIIEDINRDMEAISDIIE